LTRTCIVTTNLAFKDWGTLFHNSAAASAHGPTSLPQITMADLPPL
jgi:hypothetical protein